MGNFLYGLYATAYEPSPDPATYWVTDQTAVVLTACGWPTESENQTTVGQSIMEREENLSGAAGAENAGGLAIENLALTLRVELEARKLSLAEIADLRENQILELGIRPTDSVNLLIENRVVGRGELVEIEDRLGVRITKLMR